MLVNNSLTVYHRKYNEETRDYEWIRYNYGDEKNKTVWFFGGKGSGINKGYENANDCQVRIWYDLNKNLNIENFARGDIIVAGTLKMDITTQEDLKDYTIYKLTSMNDDTFGGSQHIHIGGR